MNVWNKKQLVSLVDMKVVLFLKADSAYTPGIVLGTIWPVGTIQLCQTLPLGSFQGQVGCQGQ